MTSTIKVNTIQNTCGADIIKESSNTITLGASGDTVTLASGASQTGFGRTGTVDWQTGSIKTATFTAANGEGYFANTSGGAFTMNLPAGTAGNIVSVVDYTNTFQTNSLTVTPNGSQKIGGIAASAILNSQGQSVTFVYVDDTEGWKNVQDSTSSVIGAAFITATGGNTIITCGNFKSHIFTSPGTFCVSGISNTPANNEVDYLVVAGGGGAGGYSGGAGGAGGFRVSNATCMPSPQTSPLATPTGITVTATGFPITVGGGGAAGPYPASPQAAGVQGSTSSFSTISSAGGGFGNSYSGNPPSNPAGGPGGSGGGSAGDGPGSASYTTAGTGNTPPVSPPQGNNGGRGVHRGAVGNGGGGGGGAAAAGSDSNNPSSPGGFAAGAGGAGSFVVSGGFAGCQGESGPVSGARYFAGGGGGGTGNGGSSAAGGAGGLGGGGDGTSAKPGAAASTAGGTNTGGGGGGAAGGTGPQAGRAGGSGIVIIRYKFQ